MIAGYIYFIINKTTGKRYVGQTTQIEARLAKHLTYLRGNYHHSHKLQRAFNKYGEDDFRIEVKKVLLPDVQNLLLLEQQLIDKYDSYENGYNETRGGEGTQTFFDFDTSVLLYQIGQRYIGVIHKLAQYYNCDRTTIKAVFNRDCLDKITYQEKDLQDLIYKIGLTDDNLKENYQDNYSRLLTKDQVFDILALIESLHVSQSACARTFNITKDVINKIVVGKTYKADVIAYNDLTSEQKNSLFEKVKNDYPNILHEHYQGQRGAVKNPLTQAQVDYILDNLGKKTQVAIAKDLNISSDRVSSVKRGLSYKDLILDYQKRHSS